MANPGAEIAGLRAALVLERLWHARTKRKLWRERYDHAAHMLDVTDRKIVELTKENESGESEDV